MKPAARAPTDVGLVTDPILRECQVVMVTCPVSQPLAGRAAAPFKASSKSCQQAAARPTLGLIKVCIKLASTPSRYWFLS